MPARLLTLDGGRDIYVDGEVVVGRDPDCEARIESQRVSRRHCVLIEMNGAVKVHDLDSTNGTWINSRRVRSGLLRPGDILQIAYLRFRVEVDRAEWTSHVDSPIRLPADCSVLTGLTATDLRNES
jgi:predicted component of type VI protein secretion system